MATTNINPWPWSTAFGFSQAVLTEVPQRLLFCSGQTAIGPDGMPPSAEAADMRSQVTAAMANLATVLANAGMTMADVVRLTVFTTDVDEFVACFRSVTSVADHLPAITLIGVQRLAYPELTVEIEATAVAGVAAGDGAS